MLNFNAIINRGMRQAMPERHALVEACGFGLLAFGAFLALATFTYDPNDYLIGDYDPNKITNLAGPVGAWLAHQVLGSFGVVGLAVPMILIVWGLLIVLGFTLAPAPRRVVGFICLLIMTAGLAQVQLAVMALAEPSFGYGGRIGIALARFLQHHLGYGGAIIALLALGFSSLVLTGNLAISSTRGYLQAIVYFGIKSFRKIHEWTKDTSLSDEELIKQALREEMRRSRKLGERVGSVSKAKSGSSELHQTASTMENSDRKRVKSTKPKSNELNLEAMADDILLEGDKDVAPVEGNAAIDFYYSGPAHGKPSAAMFSKSSKARDRSAEFEKMAEKLTAQLAQFKVDGKVRKIVEGPVVTTFEFEPVPGTKVSKITGLSQDLARLLQASSLRILAPIPGKKVIGFEVPNAERRMIGFSDLVAHRDLKSSKIALPVAMGVDAFGKVVIEDLAKMPHLLVAGSTGSGKSVFMNTLIGGLIARHSAKDLRFVMVDPKMVELAAYNNLPHMSCPVITDPAGEAKATLDALVCEMEDRFNKMRIVGARNIEGFNEIIKKGKKTDFPQFEGKWQPMPFIVLIIDELADMMMVLGKDAEVPITRLAQKARAAGMHLVIATQRPSADVVTGLIKANFPTRVAFRVLSGLDSRTILDCNGAEALIGQGDMLFLNAAGLRRMHGAFLSDAEVHAMVKACKKGKS